MTTEELYKYVTSLSKSQRCLALPRIYNVSSINLPEVSLPIDPYVLGV